MWAGNLIKSHATQMKMEYERVHEALAEE